MRTSELIRRLLKEALKDEIPQYMTNILAKRYKPEYLERDVPKHTELIPNVKIPIDDTGLVDKQKKRLVDYFMKNIVDQFKKSDVEYQLTVNKTFFNTAVQSNEQLPNIDIHNDSNDEIIKYIEVLYGKDFRLPVGRDNDIKNPIFSNNKSNLFNFIKAYNRAFEGQTRMINIDMSKDKIFAGLRDVIMNFETNVNELINATLYLYISDKPDDKLRMSISQYYDSCQNIYTGGDTGTAHNKKLLSNVFDTNSKIAYLIFDKPFVDNNGNPHPFTPVSRTMIRVSDGKIMFDKVYPVEMKDDMYDIITKYTGLENTGSAHDIYKYKGIGLPSPYMDKYDLEYSEDSENTSTPRIDALSSYLDVLDRHIEEVYETNYKYNDEEYYVMTLDEANTYTKQYFTDAWQELMWDEKLAKIINTTWFDFDKFSERMRVEDPNEFKEFILDEDYTVGEFSSLGTKYREIINNAVEFGIVDIDKFLAYYYPYGQPRGYNSKTRGRALADYDGHEFENNGFYIYRHT